MTMARAFHNTILMYMKEEEKNWEASGKPEQHLYHDLHTMSDVLHGVKASNDADVNKRVEAVERVVAAYLPDEEKHWESENQPTNHIYHSLRNLSILIGVGKVLKS